MSRRYVIYGAGAIGGVIGAGLALSGHDVALIARGAHLEALRDRGMEFRTVAETRTVEIPAVGDPAELDITPSDVVILAMKTQDTEASLAALSNSSPPDVAVVCAQNGVENERLALRRFANVYGMCVMLPGVHLEPGVVEGAGTPVYGVLDVGRYPGGSDDVAKDLTTALSSSGFRSRVDDAVMRYKYAKLRLNTGNALDAACGPAHRETDLARRAAKEALTVFTAAGIDVASREEEAERRADFKTEEIDGQRRAGSSSWQSLAKGSGSIEADYLNGEVVLLGREHGIATPVNETLRQLANRMAKDHAEPGSISAAEVEAMIADAT